MTILLAAAAMAAAVQPSSTESVPKPQAMASGHYEWRAAPNFGPRSTGPSMRRIWVADSKSPACDCSMMAVDPTTCMHRPSADRPRGAS